LPKRGHLAAVRARLQVTPAERGDLRPAEPGDVQQAQQDLVTPPGLERQQSMDVDLGQDPLGERVFLCCSLTAAPTLSGS
jgi:hypothetical protein